MRQRKPGDNLVQQNHKPQLSEVLGRGGVAKGREDDVEDEDKVKGFEMNNHTEEHYLNQAVQLIHEEALEANLNFPPFNSGHEGYSVILEELDELWEEIKKKALRTSPKMLDEAIQVGAMAVRFIADICLTKDED